MWKKTSLVILLGIVILGAFLRLYQINTAPPGLLVDEPDIGYNAYSILKTGRDEFGNFLPLSFKSYGDQKLPAYIYADVLPVKLFGLTPFSVRFPAILSGLLVIVLSYFILRLLKFNETVSLLGVLVTAVSPWTIVLSRYAWESSLGMAVLFSAVLFAILAYQTSRYRYFALTGFLLGLCWYTYLPFRPVSFVLLVLTSLWVWKFKKFSLKKIGVSWLFFIFMILPLTPIIFSRSGNLHAASSTIFNSPSTAAVINENRTFCTLQYPKLFCYLNSNKPMLYFLSATHNAVRFFSTDFLFFQGEEAKYLSVDNYGLLPFLLVPFYFIGLFQVLKNLNKRDKTGWLFLLSLLASLLPVVVSDPQRIRMAPAYIFFLIILALGMQSVIIYFKKSVYHILFGILLVFFGFVYMFNFTATKVPKYFDNWQFVGQLNRYLGTLNQTTPVFMKPVYAQPLAYYVFYNKVDPVLYQKTVQTSTPEANGYFMVTHISNITVNKLTLDEAACRLPKNGLFVTDEKSRQAAPLYTGKSSSGIYTLAYVYKVQDLPLPTKGCR